MFMCLCILYVYKRILNHIYELYIYPIPILALKASSTSGSTLHPLNDGLHGYCLHSYNMRICSMYCADKILRSKLANRCTLNSKQFYRI